MPQTTDAPPPGSTSAADVFDRFGHLGGDAFKCAIALEAEPPRGSVGIAWIRRLLASGTARASRVYHELLAAGLLIVDRARNAATGRVHGQRTTWHRPTPRQTPCDGAESALDLLRSIAFADPRLAFPDAELETVVPHVLARLAAGDTEADIYTRLVARLPRDEVTTGLLHYRLTHDHPTPEPPPAATHIPVQRTALTECNDCGRPSPTPLQDDLCGHCRNGTIPGPPDLPTRIERLKALAGSHFG
ncbi:hypothetical protein [Streptomyces sp. SID3343]|uniref:hypothetical protein n=1 Tax=Streptomyces sp. SID3343 TaxID=2690260 RepID=UPI00136AA51E|nr:hypothetical protein [Streptomyces sp. SID3343]MYW03927.1 hypothetical protein [Streptomyces sp. SID3343]